MAALNYNTANKMVVNENKSAVLVFSNKISNVKRWLIGKVLNEKDNYVRVWMEECGSATEHLYRTFITFIIIYMLHPSRLY